MLKRFALALLACISFAPGALAQSAVTQNGSIVQQHLPLWRQDRQIGDVGGLLGQTSGPFLGRGAAPFSITDDRSCGLQFNDATTTGSFNYFCFGHNTSGAAIIRVNGTDFPLIAGGTVSGVPVAADNVALQGLSTATITTVLRREHTVGRGGPTVVYRASTSACTTPDGGIQVVSGNGLCWIAATDANGIDVRVWGAVGNAVADDGPAFRAACTYAYSATGNSVPILVPPGKFLFNTLEVDGGAGVYLSSGNDDGRACHLIGSTSADAVINPPIDGPAVLKLGDAKNRPVARLREGGTNVHIKNITFDGNWGLQTGWAGGPGGKLYVLQADDTLNVDPETGFILDDVAIQGGYNGLLYVGQARTLFSNRLWAAFSGQTTGDIAVHIKSYDSQLYFPIIGSNAGIGLFLQSGNQLQMFGGAVYSSGACGIFIGGYQVNYANITGTNIQYNVDGICNANNAPFAGQRAAGIICTGCTFDGNSASDVRLDVGPQSNRQMKLVSPVFVGRLESAQANPTYNINIVGGNAGIVEIVNPSFNTSGISWTTAFTNAPALVYCNGSECPTTAFTPTFGNGTPTYSTQVGYAVRQGSLAYVTASIGVTNLGGASGGMFIGGLPWLHAALASGQGNCSVDGVTGWTAPANYTWLTGHLVNAGNTIIIHRNAVNGGATANSDAAEWAAASALSISCTYIAAP